MRTIVGLGNPGKPYTGSRHNVGFAVIEELAARWRWALGRKRKGMRITEGVVAGQPTRLVEPQMYMNLSGDALARLEPPTSAAELIVIHDDIDLDAGRIRVKRGGGAAGHRGVESIVEHFGANFTRVRIGVGRPPRGVDPADYVLSPIEAEDRNVLGAAVQRAADAVEDILFNGEEAAMNSFNVRTKGAGVAAPTGRN
jgi:PTH1 family peptidyl-tRNA hydrolase